MWNSQIRRIFQDHGVHVSPANYYSSIPTLKEIENSFEYKNEKAVYLNEDVFKHHMLTKVLESLITYSEDFNPPHQENIDRPLDFFLNNDQFSLSDAFAYYSFIRKIKPKTIIEVWSGNSTRIALQAIKKNGMGVVYCVEPYPSEALEELCHSKKFI